MKILKEIISKDKNIGIIAIIFTFYAIFHHAFQIIFSAELFTPGESYLFIKIFSIFVLQIKRNEIENY